MAAQVYPWLLPAVLVGTVFLGVWIARTIRRRFHDNRRPTVAGVHYGIVPPFFWHGFLILTPVLLLSGFGLAFIVRDRAEAERAARQQAEDWLSRLGPQFDGALGYNVMSPARGYGSLWFQAHWNGLSGWPLDPDVMRTVSMSSNQLASLGSWTDFVVGFPLLDFAPEQAVFERDLALNHPLPAVRVPQPAPWLEEMTPEWRRQWEQLKSPVAWGMNPSTGSNLLAQLRRTTSHGVVHFNLDLERARGFMSTDRTAARQELLKLARVGPGQLTETGVPIPNIAMALLLRITEPNEIDEEFWTALRDQVFQVPSLLTPVLLKQAKPLIDRVTRPSGLPAALQALNTCSDGFERLRDLSEALRNSGFIQSTNTAAVWLNTSRGRYLAICRPSAAFTTVNVSNRLETSRRALIEARFFPKPVVAASVRAAIRDSRAPLLSYFAIDAMVAGESFPNVTLWEQYAAATATPEILASRSGYLNSSEEWNPQLLAYSGKTNSVDGLPSHPPFTIRVRLADPLAFFTEQRRRAWMLGGLILLGGLTSTLGFFNARAAFLKQRRLAEEQANFVSSVSHELRSPIASVRLLAEGLEAGRIQDPGKQQQYYEFIVRETRRLGDLVENVLGLARIDQGSVRYEMEPTDLIRLVGETMDGFQPVASGRDVNVEWFIDGREPSSEASRNSACVILADGRALQQALLNLLDNALKHSPPGSTIRMDLTPPNATQGMVPVASIKNRKADAAGIVLTVTDHGPGIPPEEHQRIFKRFYRRGSELRRETPGVGLGLAIVSHIAEAHHGRVWVESETGRGAKFSLWIPVGNV